MGKNIPKECVEAYAIGLNKGFYVQKTESRAKPSNRRKGSNRTRAIRKLIQTISGLSPYEKRAIEFYKVGDGKLDKRTNKFLYRRLGTWKRSKRKEQYLREWISNRK